MLCCEYVILLDQTDDTRHLFDQILCMAATTIGKNISRDRYKKELTFLLKGFMPVSFCAQNDQQSHSFLYEFLPCARE